MVTQALSSTDFAAHMAAKRGDPPPPTQPEGVQVLQTWRVYEPGRYTVMARATLSSRSEPGTIAKLYLYRVEPGEVIGSASMGFKTRIKQAVALYQNCRFDAPTTIELRCVNAIVHPGHTLICTPE